MIDIARQLEAWTAKNSGFEISRNYVSLSNCHLTVDELVNQYKNGFEANHVQKLLCYKGYEVQRDLEKRLVAVFGDRVNPHVEIVAKEFHGFVKGHPDFTIDHYPGDFKSVVLEEHLPQQGKLPRKVFFQIQGYMLYAGIDRGVVVYESRDTGKIQDYWVREHSGIQLEIHDKLTKVVNIINPLNT